MNTGKKLGDLDDGARFDDVDSTPIDLEGGSDPFDMVGDSDPFELDEGAMPFIDPPSRYDDNSSRRRALTLWISSICGIAFLVYAAFAAGVLHPNSICVHLVGGKDAIESLAPGQPVTCDSTKIGEVRKIAFQPASSQYEAFLFIDKDANRWLLRDKAEFRLAKEGGVEVKNKGSSLAPLQNDCVVNLQESSGFINYIKDRVNVLKNDEPADAASDSWKNDVKDSVGATMIVAGVVVGFVLCFVVWKLFKLILPVVLLAVVVVAGVGAYVVFSGQASVDDLNRRVFGDAIGQSCEVDLEPVETPQNEEEVQEDSGVERDN